MKEHTVQQEILLVTNTTFSKRQLCEMKPDNDKRHLSNTEQLEKACWDGLLDELLPEIMERSTSGKSLFMFHIRNAKACLQIAMSESAVAPETQFSNDPSLFLLSLSVNN